MCLPRKNRFAFSVSKALVIICVCGSLVGCENQSFESKQTQLLGAGATFPAPLYEQWFREVAKSHPELKIQYEGVGSGAGVQQFIDELVDFGASDDPLTEEEIAQVDRGVRQLPMTAGGIVLAYNLIDTSGSAVTNLRLSRQALVDIFLGNIKSWDDDEIVRHNPGLSLPKTPIQVEYRLDASGTTSAVTRHLAELSEAWKSGPGIGKTVAWPVGAGMPKDRGVARGIRQVPGSIGYLSFAVAQQEKLPMATVENKSGNFIEPNAESIQIGLSSLRWSIDESSSHVVDPEHPNAYPIVTYSWILCYRIYDDPEKLELLKQLLTYGLREGQRFSADLGYAPLATTVTDSAVNSLATITLPQTADTATSLPVTTADAKPSVIASVTSTDETSPAGVAGSATIAPSSADVQADDVSVQDAADTEATPRKPSENQREESSAPEDDDAASTNGNQAKAQRISPDIAHSAMSFDQQVLAERGAI